MENLNKGQKIFLTILGIIVVIVLLIYYTTREDNTEYSEIDNIYIENEIEEENIDGEEEIVIHIIGAVNKEGIVKLKSGDRISDAIEKAGGATENADLSKINLAYIVEDGQKINIPNKDEENTNTEYITTDSGNAIVENEQSSEEIGKVNINTATQTELETLPGIGPSTALKIIQYREENGKFDSIEDIKNVSGIGDVKYENIKDYINVK